MCAGDDRNCADFELHRQRLLDDLDAERRSFLKSAFAATGGAAALTAGGMSLVSPAAAQTVAPRQGQPKHHYVPATADTVHWGYFSKLLKPVVEVDPGDYVTIETLTHHANDDAERMVKGDPGAESVYLLGQGQEGREPARRRPDRSQRYSAAAPARDSASTSAPARSTSAMPSRATSSKCASSTSSRALRPIRPMPARPSAATRPPGGASTTRSC